jgi:leucyl aminopeptidase
MKFTIVTDKPISDSAADVIVLFAARETPGSESATLSPQAADADSIFGKRITGAMRKQKFAGQTGKVMLVHGIGSLTGSRTLAVTGLGSMDNVGARDWMRCIATAMRTARELFSDTVAVSIPAIVTQKLGNSEAYVRLIEAISLSLYRFDKHKLDNPTHEIGNVEIYPEDSSTRHDFASAITIAQANAEAVKLARDMVNEPSSLVTPSFMADVAKSFAGDSKRIDVEVLGLKEMKKLGMGALLAIAQGSDEEPRFIKLAYHAGGSKTICLVGKGVTFDSGGLSLKPGQGMETMKLDMAGAAAILGIFSVIARLAPNVNVVGLIAAVENMPSGKAVKPGDIVRAMNGKSIEIINTDAEGRVILADAMSYAEKNVKPDTVIDLATLTGACMVALGEDVAGLFSNTPSLTEKLKKAAGAAGELVWELPLVEGYRELIQSNVADVRNITKTRYAGAITGALFIGEFVPKNTPWAHLDIAGPAFAESDAPLTPPGGTGFGVRMLLEYLRSFE